MNTEEEHLKQVFKELRQEDQKEIQVPSFQSFIADSRSRKKFYWPWIAAAAVIAIGLSVFPWNQNANASSQEADLTIVLAQDNLSSDLLLEISDSDIFNWSADSDALINEFEQ